MSAQQFEKAVTQILDLEKRTRGFFENFKISDALHHILKKKEGKQKNKALIQYLDQLSSPVRYHTLSQIKKEARPIEKNIEITLSWDESLEHKYINISKKITQKEDLSRFIKNLSQNKEQLNNLLDKL